MTIKTLMLAGVAGAAVLAAVPFSPQPVSAQTKTYVAPQEGESDDEQSSQEMRKRKQGQTSEDESSEEMKKKRGEGEDQSSREREKDRKEATVDRDRKRGDRSRRREGKFRYFHEGYYYATPWWTTGVVVDAGGISCREGARIVSRRGFNRVSPIACGGEVYSYRGWRGGDPWRVRIDSDTGRIISVRPAG